MATGDLANNLRKLQKELKLIKYSENVDLSGMSQGTPTAFLPIYHYVFTSYSHAIAELISSSDTELFGKTDFRFIEAVYKIMRDLFTYKPPITKDQFFNAGFAERKIIMCAEVVQKLREKNRSLQPNKRPTSAVSTISQNLHKKQSKPKTTDSAKPSSQPASTKQSSRTLSDQQKQVKFAQEEVVNELRQPLKPTNRHIAHKDPPSPVAIVNMSPSVTKEIVSMDEQPSRGFKYAVVTPAVAKQPSRSSKNVESAASKGLNFEDESESIEIVSATTPDHSLYEPFHSTGIIPEELQDHVSTLQQSVETITERLSGFESAITTVTQSLQDHQSSTDPKLLTVVTNIQQQIENLTARMVLMENRVAIVESKLQTTQAQPEKNPKAAAVVNGHKEYLTSTQGPSLSQGLPYEREAYKSSQLPACEKQNGQTSAKMYQNEPITRQIRSQGDRDLVGHHLNENGQSAEPLHPESSTKSLSANYSGDASLPGHLTGSDQFSFALSPIRKIKDTSGYKPSQNATGEDTFALEAEDDARRSSTPTDLKDLPLKPTHDESTSYHFGDVSTQERVDRIKNLMAATQNMLVNK